MFREDSYTCKQSTKVPKIRVFFTHSVDVSRCVLYSYDMAERGTNKMVWLAAHCTVRRLRLYPHSLYIYPVVLPYPSPLPLPYPGK